MTYEKFRRYMLSYIHPCLDFYNLHLTPGHAVDYDPIRDGIEECLEQIRYPDEEEQRKLVDFFSGHQREITRYMSAKDLCDQWKRQGADGLMYVMDHMDSKGSLGEYELREIFKKVQTTRDRYKNFENFLRSWDLPDYIAKYEFPWFKSDSFLEFAKEYCQTKLLIDSYIRRWKIPTSSLLWLNRSLGGYKRELSLIDIRGGFNMPVSIDLLDNYEDERVDSIDLNEYGFTVDRIFDRGELEYGIRLRGLMFRIHRGLVMMLEWKPQLLYCSFEGGKRLPPCKNIFMPNTPHQRYCSEKCYHRARRSRRYRKTGK